MKKTLLITALLITLTTTAYAKDIGNFLIHPTYKHGENSSWIIQKAHKGQTIKDYITIENPSDETIKLTLKTVEAEEINNQFTLLDNKPQKDLALWTTIPRKTYTLAPKQKQKIPITIKIPTTAKEKTYKASILASKTTKNKDNIKIVTRIGVRMYIEIVPQNTQTNIITKDQYDKTTLLIISIIAFLSAIILNLKPKTQKNKNQNQ